MESQVNKMDHKEFVSKIIALYHEARLPKYQNNKISRGRSHTISSSVEDLFANFLIDNDKTIDKILIDQPMKIKTKTIYPDITIIYDNEITAFMDLKMDLGWMRGGLADLYKKDQLLMDVARGNSCRYKYGSKKEFYKEIQVSKKAIYDIVVISDQNISEAMLKNQIEMINEFETESVKLHILTKNLHLNTYGLDHNYVLDKVEIDESQFNDLFHRIK